MRRNSLQSLRSQVPPAFPWEKIGTDLFEFRGENYIVSAYYGSNFPEVTKMESMRTSAVVDELKRQFGIHGILVEVISDNGPQLSSNQFQEFSKSIALNTSPACRITQKPMEKQRE